MVRPLCGRSIHNDVDPENLHCVEWVRQLHDCRQRDQCQSRNAPGNQHTVISQINIKKLDSLKHGGGSQFKTSKTAIIIL